jgi:hypothetical protein
VAVAAVLDPHVVEPDALAVAFRPEEVGAAFGRGHDVFVAQHRLHPLLLAPHPTTVGPVPGHPTLVKELAPCGAAAVLQSLHVVLDFEELSALRTGVDHLVEGVASFATGDATK